MSVNINGRKRNDEAALKADEAADEPSRLYKITTNNQAEAILICIGLDQLDTHDELISRLPCLPTQMYFNRDTRTIKSLWVFANAVPADDWRVSRFAEMAELVADALPGDDDPPELLDSDLLPGEHNLVDLDDPTVIEHLKMVITAAPAEPDCNHCVGIDLGVSERRFLPDGAMESAKIGLPVHRLLPNAYLGTDPNTLPASTVENSARPPAMIPEPRGSLARTSILLFFMSIVFLAGIFIGASLIPTPQSQTRPADISISVPVAPLIETPAPGPATTGSDASLQAIPQPGPAGATPLESRPPQFTSGDRRPEAAPAPIEPVSPQSPQSQPPSATADAPPAPIEPVGGPLIQAGTPAAARSPTATAAQPPTADPGEPGLSPLQIQALLSRGDALLAAGDVTSARLFSEHGADAGDGTAALRLGETFDPAFVERARLGRVAVDLNKAIAWYGRARDLGNTEAEILLKSVDPTKK